MSSYHADWAFHDPSLAPVIRFMQDQPMVHTASTNGTWTTKTFIHDVAGWCEDANRITSRQREMIEQIISDREWIEPPRWRPFSELKDDGRLYNILVCPGAADKDEIQAVIERCPPGATPRLCFGGFWELTSDGKDPGLKRASYVTPVWQLVAKARERGLIIGPDRARPAYEPIHCSLHRRDPDWVREPYSDEPPLGIEARLSPEPLAMLVAMRDGALLHERHGDWAEWKLHYTDGTKRMVMTRAMNRLLVTGFIDRIGDLPPGHPKKVLEFDWLVTPAGLAWMAANPKATKRAAKKYLEFQISE